MKLSVTLARKLARLGRGETLARSQLKAPLITQMLEHGILNLRSQGTRQWLWCQNPAELHTYLHNHLGINDLEHFIASADNSELRRSTAVQIASDSKLSNIRVFKGFLVNCNQPLATSLNGSAFVITPAQGAFTYIYDYDHFIPDPDITIVGVENSENFRHIESQDHFFPGIKTLFVSRYPQSKDLTTWLKAIENPYIHYGDFDFSGINIYLHEFKKQLGKRAAFFIPPGIEELFHKFGNRQLYARQLATRPKREQLPEPGLKILWDLICTTKKGLEQEILVNRQKEDNCHK